MTHNVSDAPDPIDIKRKLLSVSETLSIPNCNLTITSFADSQRPENRRRRSKTTRRNCIEDQAAQSCLRRSSTNWRASRKSNARKLSLTYGGCTMMAVSPFSCLTSSAHVATGTLAGCAYSLWQTKTRSWSLSSVRWRVCCQSFALIIPIWFCCPTSPKSPKSRP